MFNLFKRKQEKAPEVIPAPEAPKGSVLNLDLDIKTKPSALDMSLVISKSIQRTAHEFIATAPGAAMDDSQSMKSSFAQQAINDLLLSWYASQGFIGYQACAIIYQNWLVKKCCKMPARDAIRNGYELTINDGTEVSQEVIDAVTNYDKKYRINANMSKFITMGRVYGIRIAMFKVDSDDPDFYYKPFNIDGVRPGSYKGISQIDPYWVTAQLDNEAAGDPSSMHFYEPTWWKIGDKLVHRTHLVIFRNGFVPDILKPTYYWGGIPVTQLIYEAIYNAERSAAELPALLMTKRTDVLYTDMAAATANPTEFINGLNTFIGLRNNFGVKAVDFNNEKLERLDTALADADQVTMTLYQIVAAAAGVPVTKLLGTTPKGFNATGEFDEASYHEELKSIQTSDLTPLLERHHLLLIHSEIAPKFGIAPFETTVEWNPLDEMTAKELADVNRQKADTGAVLVQNGVIAPDEERKRITNDPSSGYSGLNDENVQIIQSEEQE